MFFAKCLQAYLNVENCSGIERTSYTIIIIIIIIDDDHVFFFLFFSFLSLQFNRRLRNLLKKLLRCFKATNGVYIYIYQDFLLNCNIM